MTEWWFICFFLALWRWRLWAKNLSYRDLRYSVPLFWGDHHWATATSAHHLVVPITHPISLASSSRPPMPMATSHTTVRPPPFLPPKYYVPIGTTYYGGGEQTRIRFTQLSLCFRITDIIADNYQLLLSIDDYYWDTTLLVSYLCIVIQACFPYLPLRCALGVP